MLLFNDVASTLKRVNRTFDSRSARFPHESVYQKQFRDVDTYDVRFNTFATVCFQIHPF